MMPARSRGPAPPRLPLLPQSVPAARPPDWSLERTRTRACPVCGADGGETLCLRPDGLPVARCACGMVYLPQIPEPDEIRKLYERYAEHKGYAPPPARPWALHLQALRDVRLRALRETGGVAGRRVLEVGASRGQFLELVRLRGGQPFAVELDAAARAHLTARGIEAAERVPGDRRFDAACAFQVLEHLEDPGALVDELARVLEPDGRLLIAVPNAGELELVGPTWVGFRVDLEHLNYFDARALARLLSERGLWVEQVWELAQPGIGRPGAAPPLGLLDRALGKLAEASRLVRTGRYELMLLARKVEDAA